jgi:hypothetical protein
LLTRLLFRATFKPHNPAGFVAASLIDDKHARAVLFFIGKDWRPVRQVVAPLPR